MGFKKGEPRPENAGRKEGSQNKLTKTVKEVFTNVFSELQDNEHVNLKVWGEKNPTEFYKLCAKLIPAAVDLEAKVAVNTPVIIDWIQNNSCNPTE